MSNSEYIMRRINDPEYVADYIAWFKKYDYFIQELRSHGFNVQPEYQWQGYRRTEYEPIVVEAVLAVMDLLPNLEEKYFFIEFLGATTTPYNPAKVIEVYDQLDNVHWKSGIIGNLAQSNPIGITQWFRERLNDNCEPEIQNSMANYLAYSHEYENCRDILLGRYSEFPLSALKAFAEAGGEAELEFLRNYNHDSVVLDLPRAMAYYKQFLPKAIKKLENRVKRRRKKTE